MSKDDVRTVYRIKIEPLIPEIFNFKDIIYKNIFMCVLHVNGPNRFRAKLIGIGLKSLVNVVNTFGQNLILFYVKTNLPYIQFS